MLNATMFAIDIDEVMMCVGEAGVQLSDGGSVVLQESDVEEEEGDGGDDSLDEEVEEDSDVEVMGGDVDDMLGGDNGGGGFVEMPEKCRNCCRKKNAMVEDREPYCGSERV
jgi:hypothetical protein